MRSWDYNQDIISFIELLNGICTDSKSNYSFSNDEFDLIVPKKFKNLFARLSYYNNKTSNIYNLEFIDDDIDYVIIDNMDVIKIDDYYLENMIEIDDLYNNFKAYYYILGDLNYLRLPVI